MTATPATNTRHALAYSPSIILAGVGTATARLAESLRLHGYAVLCANSIRAAVDLVQVKVEVKVEGELEMKDQRRIIAAITVLALPDGNWRDLVDQMRVRAPALPIMVLASARTAELWWDVLEWGASEILPLDFQPSDLDRALGRSGGE